MTLRLLALGDSVSCGEGVGVQLRPADTWVGLLAHALGAELDLLAQSGSRVRDVRADQLPAAMARPAPLACLLIGLNDVIRAGFDAATIRTDLLAIVAALRDADTTVVLARLHNPTTVLPLPARLRRFFTERVSIVNDAVDAARGPGVLVLDLARVTTLRHRGSWAVDRLHPGPAGHLAMATAGALLLAEHGFDVLRPPAMPAVTCRPTKRAEARWVILHGAPYVVRHLHKMAVPAAGAIAGRAR
jgi:lysophospholipase L1-like esterase